jgi:hypothetical protein
MDQPTDEGQFEGSPYLPTGDGGNVTLINQDEQCIQESSYQHGFRVRAEGMQEPGRH